MGEEIDLANWKGYRGGLDTSGSMFCVDIFFQATKLIDVGDLTGKTSVYTKWQSYEIMFHVSTLLPFKADDTQRIERKRHIGNDICVLVFQDSDEHFQLASVLSRQNHIYIIVRPDGPNNYRYFLIQILPWISNEMIFIDFAWLTNEACPTFYQSFPNYQ